MYVKIIFLACALVPAFALRAQNLVINPGFETNAGCPGTSPGDQLALATGWHSARMDGGYFNACANGTSPASGVPSNASGFQQAAGGNAYAGVTAYKKGTLDRGFIYGTLSSPLVVGRVYKVTFKISLAENSSLAVSNFGAGFRVNTNDCVFNPACPFPYPIENIPNVTQDTIREDMNGWTSVTMLFGATEPYQYIVLGVFDDVPLESVQSAAASEAYYYIDDVSVTWMEDMIFDTYPGCEIRTAQYNESCVGANDASISAQVLFVEGPYSIHWEPAPGSGQGTTLITGLGAGAYTATVTTAYSSCSFTTTILQPDSIALEVSKLDPSCGKANGHIFASATDPTETYAYTWNTNPPQATDSLVDLLPGIYVLTATNEDGCTASRTYNLVNTGLILTVDPVDPEIIAGDSVQFIASGGINYTWSPPTDLSCTDCAAPFASPGLTTDYVVTGTDADGCTGSLSVRVTVRCPDVFVPTIFSPNGDGQNDYMCKLGGCTGGTVFSIYNRWGEKVFETEDMHVCWDGTFKGKPAEPGAYVYKLKVAGPNGAAELESGNITLIR